MLDIAATHMNKTVPLPLSDTALQWILEEVNTSSKTKRLSSKAIKEPGPVL